MNWLTTCNWGITPTSEQPVGCETPLDCPLADGGFLPLATH